MKNQTIKINDPSFRRGRRTNDTIVSAVMHTIQLFIQFVKQQIHKNGETVWSEL